MSDWNSGGPGSLRGDDSTYSGYQRPGVRLTEPYDRELAALTMESYALFALGLQAFDKAHLVMLAEEGIIPREGAAACLRVLREVDRQGAQAARAEVKHSLHGGEVILIRRLGMEVGGLIHAGRSSWDLGRVAWRLGERERLVKVMEGLNGYREALLDLSVQHVETIMPYYTHGQQAQPTTFAHHMHAFACAAERDVERLRLALDHVNISPAGSAAGTSAPFPVNRERTAELLGFDRPATNTRDISYNMDHRWEMAAALTGVAASLGFLGDELILWMGNEFGLVRIADRYCTTSSIMTHKRNPRGAEMLQAVRERVAGRGITSYTPGELLQASDAVAQALRFAAGMVSTLTVNVERMRQRTQDSWAQIPDLCGYLVREHGLPWRMAHQVLGIMCRLAEEEGVAPGTPSPELLDRASVLFLGRPLGLSREEIARGLDPERALALRTATGSPGPDEMRRQIAASRERLAEDRAALQARVEGFAAAAERLERAIDDLLGE